MREQAEREHQHTSAWATTSEVGGSGVPGAATARASHEGPRSRRAAAREEGEDAATRASHTPCDDAIRSSFSSTRMF